MSMKKKSALLWAAFAICLVVTVALNRAMVNSDVDYEEVQATVVSASQTNVVKQPTGSAMATFYDVEVLYQGKTYELHNVHNTYQYREGSQVKAYLAGGELYANIEGIQTTRPLGTVYFVFLFGTMGLLFGAAIYSGKAKQEKLRQKQEQDRQKG